MVIGGTNNNPPSGIGSNVEWRTLKRHACDDAGSALHYGGNLLNRTTRKVNNASHYSRLRERWAKFGL